MYTSRQRKQLEKENKQWPEVLQEIPPSLWPPDRGDQRPIRVFRSCRFLLQVYDDMGTIRLTVARTSVDAQQGTWVENITWDDLQRLKREAGFGHLPAVEYYPPDRDIVNVANMRHLFLLEKIPTWAWRREG